jgi:hypothetical protein
VCFSLASHRFKKGDLVVVDDDGRAVVYEIVSSVAPNRMAKSSTEACYDAKQVTTGSVRTIYQDEILRLATPVDNSAQLFKEPKNKD